MKRLFTSLFLMGCAYQLSAQYVTPGNAQSYTFGSLAGIPESGVTRQGNIFTVSADIEIAEGDTLSMENLTEVRLAHGVTIDVNGHAAFAPADSAVFTRTDADAVPKGIYLRSANASGLIKNVVFEYAGLRYNGTSPLLIDHSTFRFVGVQLSSTAAITLGSGGKTTISNCRFLENKSAAVGMGANLQHAVTFTDNYLYDNSTLNTNRPQINLTSPGDGQHYIARNTIVGTGRNMVGGIAVANLLSMPGSNRVVIENNHISKCRYGITVMGPMDALIKDNVLIENNYEQNPMNGGSGISLYDSSGKLKAMITGNHIEKHLWGITVIGGKEVNIGKVDATAPDYNPGLNVFKENGNNGQLYDLYNNTALTVYAQGNTWNVASQTAEMIETVVFHKPDDPTLGEVIYMPAAQVAQAAAPHTLRGNSKVSNVALSWKSPVEPRTLQWHTGRDYDGVNGESINGGVPVIYIANQFEPADLKEYSGAVIDSISYFHYRPVLDVSLLIMEDGNVVYEQPVNIGATPLNKKNAVKLENPYTIRPDVTLTLAVKLVHGTNLDFVGIIDQGPSVPGKGDLYSFDGENWMSISRGNFLVTGHIAMPEALTPDGFHVYRGEERLTEEPINATAVLLSEEPKGEWNYRVSAVYGQDEIFGNGLSLYNTPAADMRPVVRDVRASVSGLTGTLTWMAPVCAEPSLTWTNGIGDKSMGGTSGTPRKLWAVNSFTSNQLLSYTNHQLTAIDVVLNGAVQTMKLVIFENSKIVYSEDVPAEVLATLALNTWHKFTLTTPYPINPAANLMYGYYVTHASGVYPAKLDQGPAKLQGCYISGSTAKSDFNQSTPVWNLVEKTLSANWMLRADIVGDSSYPTVEGYDVYCNDVLLHSALADAACVVEGVPGTANYSIFARFADETRSSEAVSATCSYLLPAEYVAPVWTSKSFENGNLSLAWNLFLDLPSEIKHYQTPGFYYALTNGGEDVSIYMGAQFDTQQIAAYSNYEITGVSLMLNAPFKSLKVLVRSGSTLLASKTITSLPLLEMQTVLFDKPVDLPLDATLTVGYQIVYADGNYPIVMDEGPVKKGGAMISFDGNSWNSLSMIDNTVTNIVVGASVRAKESAAQPAAEKAPMAVRRLMAKDRDMQALVDNSLIGVDREVQLSKEQAKPEVVAYRLYCNGQFLHETTETSYEELLPYGTYAFEVSALYSNGWESARSARFDCRYQQPNLSPAPYGLLGELAGNDLQLMWASPESAYELSRQKKDGSSFAVGLTKSSGVEGWFFIAYDADELVDYVGDFISHIKIGLHEINLTELRAVVCLDRNIVYEQVVDLAGIQTGENVVRLDTPFEIPAGREVCVGYYVAHPNGVKPNLTDEGPAVDGKGNLIFTGSWRTLLSMNSALNYNWRIAGVIQKKNITLKTIQQAADETPTTYTLYHNGNVIQAGLTATNIVVPNATSGAYWVTAQTGDVESAPSNSVEIGAATDLSNATEMQAVYDARRHLMLCRSEAMGRIFDLNGRKVAELQGVTMDLTSLSQGVYVVELSYTDGRTIRMRIVR